MPMHGPGVRSAMFSNTWSEIQALRRNQSALRRQLKRRRWERQRALGGGGEELPEEEAAGIPSLKPSVERKLLELFLNPTLEFPLPAATLCSKVLRMNTC